MTLDHLPLPAAAVSALRRKVVILVVDLTRLTKKDAEAVSGVGRRSISILQTELKRRGLDFRSPQFRAETS